MGGRQILGRRVGSWAVGILAFQDTLMIGRWERWSLCFGSFILWLLEEMWRILWAGEKVGLVVFLLVLSTVPTEELLVILSFGALFGGLGLQWEWVFLLGKRLGIEFWLSTSWKEGDGTCQIDVSCVKMKKKLTTIFFCFVTKLVCCGIWFSPFLMCNGLCISPWGVTCLDGMTLLWVKEGWRRGGLLLYAFYGPYGRKGMEERSMVSNRLTKPSNFLFCIILWIGLGYI